MDLIIDKCIQMQKMACSVFSCKSGQGAYFSGAHVSNSTCVTFKHRTSFEISRLGGWGWEYGTFFFCGVLIYCTYLLALLCPPWSLWLRAGHKYLIWAAQTGLKTTKCCYVCYYFHLCYKVTAYYLNTKSGNFNNKKTVLMNEKYNRNDLPYYSMCLMP